MASWRQQISSALYSHLQRALKNNHGRVVLVGLLIGLAYLPAWLGYLIPQALKGKIGWFLIFGMLSLAILELWNQRKMLEQLEASEEDRLLGYLLVGSSTVLFPFCRFAIWPQALLWLMILIGIVCMTWGISFFRRFMLPTFFVGLTVYPRIGIISRFVWELFFSYQSLEKAMASATSVVMQGIGFPATQQGAFIILPEGAVEVGWGCNGLDMAITIAAAGLFMGLLHKQKRRQMIWLISAAVVVALIVNIPRLILMTLAHVYWGEWWFHFWHGFWGGQIFSGVLFTVYYYITMALIERQRLSEKRQRKEALSEYLP